MASKLRFSDGEKVLCFDGPLLYEAKCITSRCKEKNMEYFIHYSGWNKNRDEWVPESRVLELNNANMRKKRELEAAHGKGGKKTKKIITTSKEDPTDRESSAVPPQDKTSKQKGKDAAAAAPPPSTESQAELQRKKRTPRAEQNVATNSLVKYETTQNFADYLRNRTPMREISREAVLNECVIGLRDYIESMPVNSQYPKFERPQHNEIRKNYDK